MEEGRAIETDSCVEWQHTARYAPSRMHLPVFVPEARVRVHTCARVRACVRTHMQSFAGACACGSALL